MYLTVLVLIRWKQNTFSIFKIKFLIQILLMLTIFVYWHQFCEYNFSLHHPKLHHSTIRYIFIISSRVRFGYKTACLQYLLLSFFSQVGLRFFQILSTPGSNPYTGTVQFKIKHLFSVKIYFLWPFSEFLWMSNNLH